MTSATVATANYYAAPCRTCRRWGLPCPFCIQSAPHPSPVDSDWSEEDWDGDIEGRKRQEKQRKEEKVREKQEEYRIPDYNPLNLIYDLDQEEEVLLKLTPKEKLDLDPKYYPQNYMPKQEDAPTLVDDLVPIVKEEDKGEEQDKVKKNEKKKKNRFKRRGGGLRKLFGLYSLRL